MRGKFYKSLVFQIICALVVLSTLDVGFIGYTHLEAQQRQFDSLVLNLAGNIQNSTQIIIKQSRNYLDNAPRDYPTYHRDVNLYYEDLKAYISDTDHIVEAYSNGVFDSDLTGIGTTIRVNYDEKVSAAVERLTHTWAEFRTKLDAAIGSNVKEPRLEFAARQIVADGFLLSSIIDHLVKQNQRLITAKLKELAQVNRLVLLGSLGIMLAIAVWFFFRVLRPLKQAEDGFIRVSQGDFGHHVPVVGENEIGRMSDAFNSLSTRLYSLFRLIDKMHKGSDLDSTLRFTWEEFSSFIPLDWVALLLLSPDESSLELERAYAYGESADTKRWIFPIENSILGKALTSGESKRIASLDHHIQEPDKDRFIDLLLDKELQHAIVLPLSGERLEKGVLVFATRQANAYSGEHLELLTNIAHIMTRALEKTVVMENLVVTAVQGLAGLAESRDPETGDHLVRMSAYSSILAEELSKDNPYADIIRPRYIRDIYRFAPMHDIGKVGIPDQILLKGSDLEPAEREAMGQHTLIGGAVLRQCEEQMNKVGQSIFTVGIEIAECHHEKYDGSGYPKGLKGEEIPLSARIIAVADVFDALTSKRPYKEAWSFSDSLAWIKEQSGKQFDPKIVDALERAIPKIQKVYEQFKHV